MKHLKNFNETYAPLSDEELDKLSKYKRESLLYRKVEQKILYAYYINGLKEGYLAANPDATGTVRIGDVELDNIEDISNLKTLSELSNHYKEEFINLLEILNIEI